MFYLPESQVGINLDRKGKVFLELRINISQYLSVYTILKIHSKVAYVTFLEYRAPKEEDGIRAVKIKFDIYR